MGSTELFAEKLEGFEAKKAVFNVPYNQSTPELEEWLPSVVRAFRTGGGGRLKFSSTPRIWITSSGLWP